MQGTAGYCVISLDNIVINTPCLYTEKTTQLKTRRLFAFRMLNDFLGNLYVIQYNCYLYISCLHTEAHFSQYGILEQGVVDS